MADEVATERVACQEDLLLEGLVGGRLRFLDDFPIEQHDLSEGVRLVLDGDDVGDDVHDDGREGLVGNDALDQIFHGSHLFIEGAGRDASFELFEVGGVFAGT